MFNKKIICLILIIIAAGNIFSVDFTVSTNNNGKIDRWINCELSKDWRKLDMNANGKPDESCFYVSDKNIVYLITDEKMDSFGTGNPNIFIKITVKGSNFFKEMKVDSNGDGKIDLSRYEQNDKVYLEKYDENFDGKIDRIVEFDKDGIMSKESLDKITPDEVEVDFFEKNILANLNGTNKNIVSSSYNKDSSKKVYAIKSGLKVDEKKKLDAALLTLGYNDEKMDKFYSYMPTGEVLLEEYDTNNDGKIDMWLRYAYKNDRSLKEIVIEKDNNYDGKVDDWQFTDSTRSVIRVEKDTNFDGKVDSVKKF
jgi:hypothetical protein